MQSNAGKYHDTTPDLRAAGKLFDQGGDAQTVLKTGENTDVPDAIAKYTNTNAERPGVGEQRSRHHGKWHDPEVASRLCHGIRSTNSLKASELISPERRSRLEEELNRRRELVYSSTRDRPLGKARDLSSHVPDDLDTINTAFGRKTCFDGTVKECVNPDVSRDQIEEETNKFHQLYVTTHHDYHVGEHPDRGYDWSKVAKDSVFGVPTPHNNTGELTGRSLKWIHDDGEKGARIVSQILDKFRERTQPQLGKVLDPMADTRSVGADHTYGIMLRPDEYGAGDLIHGRQPDSYLRGRDRERGVLHAIRQHLKKSNYHNFDSLQQAFAHYDKNKDGMIDAGELRDVCHQLNVPVEDEMLALLMSYCVGDDSDGDADVIGIDYVKFANFLNWKDKSTMPVAPVDEDDESAAKGRAADTPVLPKQIDGALTQHKTSSSVIGALNGISTSRYRSYGIPTVRSDIAAPLLRRVSDRKNYGDESAAWGLISPNVYARSGLTERDFFLPRPQAEIKRIFAAIGVEMSDESFQEAWRRAKASDPRGRSEVCVETFRMVLDDAQGAACAAK